MAMGLGEICPPWRRDEFFGREMGEIDIEIDHRLDARWGQFIKGKSMCNNTRTEVNENLCGHLGVAQVFRWDVTTRTFCTLRKFRPLWRSAYSICRFCMHCTDRPRRRSQTKLQRRY